MTRLTTEEGKFIVDVLEYLADGGDREDVVPADDRSVMKYAGVCETLERATDLCFEDIFTKQEIREFPLFSGNDWYPIPAPSEEVCYTWVYELDGERYSKTPTDDPRKRASSVFNDEVLDLWGDDEYGDTRREYCQYLADIFKEYLK